MVLLKDFPSWREKSSDTILHIDSMHRKTKCRVILYVENAKPVVSIALRKTAFPERLLTTYWGVWVGE